MTTLKVVPRGTEGAISVEGTIAGLLASILLASVGYFLGEVNLSIKWTVSSKYDSIMFASDLTYVSVSYQLGPTSLT